MNSPMYVGFPSLDNDCHGRIWTRFGLIASNNVQNLKNLTLDIQQDATGMLNVSLQSVMMTPARWRQEQITRVVPRLALASASMTSNQAEQGFVRTTEPEAVAGKPLTEIITASYPALRRMAAARATNSGVSASSLTHETICRLMRLPTPPKDQDALQGIAHQLMEWGLVDRLRQRGRRQRHELEAFAQIPSGPTSLAPQSLSMSSALGALAENSPRKAEVVTLWAVGGLSMKQIAAALEISEKTVQRDLDFARAWLAATAAKGVS